MSEGLILAALAGVAVIAAVLSFAAWHLLGRRAGADADHEEDARRGFDSTDPGV